MKIIGIGMRLRMLRYERNLTMKQVAARAGIAVSTLSGYENEDKHPSYPVLISLATIYNTSADYLLGKSAKRTLDVTGLSEKEIASLVQIIEIFRENRG